MRPLSLPLFLVAAAFVAAPLSAPVHAQPASAAQAKEGWYKHIVDFDFVKPHAELPRDDKAALLVDSRPAARRYDIGHIPGAINIPDTQFEKLAPQLLPADKNALIIFYCQGFDCDLSHKSAFKAEAMGYTNVKVYAAGIPDWEAKGELLSVSTAYVKKLLDEKADFMLIDSRPARTFEKGSIPGAVNIPDTQFEKMTDKLPADKNKMLVFFCGGLKCDLSSKSARKAKALGYTKVFVYAEGYPAWQAATGASSSTAAPASAQPTATGTAASSGVIPIEPGKEKGSISAASFERILKENPNQIVIVDVRDEKDVKKGTFPGAINIPINDLEKKLATLPKDKPIVFTCATGARSGEAYDTVKMLGAGLQAYFLDAEVTFKDGGYSIKGR
ncbi:MAG: rhodanese-like domain-containing protein [Rhodocyclaceae bacterium]|nr:rhodanese-like domain-containing protein [Rhodocyclaceae bacterium]